MIIYRKNQKGRQCRRWKRWSGTRVYYLGSILYNKILRHIQSPRSAMIRLTKLWKNKQHIKSLRFPIFSSVTSKRFMPNDTLKGSVGASCLNYLGELEKQTRTAIIISNIWLHFIIFWTDYLKRQYREVARQREALEGKFLAKFIWIVHLDGDGLEKSLLSK